MTQEMVMSRMKHGQTAYISEISELCPIKGRLYDLGFTGGAKVCALQSDGAGSLRAYEVCGAVVAVRREDAELVRVQA